MNSRDRLSQHARALLDALVHEQLDAAGEAQLVELLQSDADFRRAYVATMATVAGIRRYLRGADVRALGAGLRGVEELQPIFRDQSASASGAAGAPSSAAPPLDLTTDGLARPLAVARPRIGPRGTETLDRIAASVRRGVDVVWRPTTAAYVAGACCLGTLLLLAVGRPQDAGRAPPAEVAAVDAAAAVAAASADATDATDAADAADGADGSQATVATAAADPFVARVVLVSPDVAWGDPKPALDFFLRARAGERLNVVAGLLQLEFISGAKIILHGPSVFIPTGPSGGRLESGRLTGEVSHGDFRLVTPTAEVIDLGTEFGVTTDAATGTDVVVFDGRVQAVSRPAGSQAGEVLDMTEGMAARFRIDGVTEYGLKTDANQFTRNMPAGGARKNLDELCLVDVLAGGDGLGTRLAGAVDPSTGRRDYGEGGRQLEVGGRPADGVFHRVDWHPVIDGVFIPPADGRQVEVDSLGHRVDLPQNVGWTHGSIWARRKESALEPTGGLDNDFWGHRTLQGIVRRLKESRLGLVGIHADAGITFDLRKVQLVHRRPASEFRALVANVENSGDWSRDERPVIPDKRTIDFRVFVDGHLRFERLRFRLEDGEREFSVALRPGDRFLTFIATDDGDIDYDHLVLIDPVIALSDN